MLCFHNAGTAGSETSDSGIAGKDCTPFNDLDVTVAFGDISGEETRCEATGPFLGGG